MLTLGDDKRIRNHSLYFCNDVEESSDLSTHIVPLNFLMEVRARDRRADKREDFLREDILAFPL